MQLLVAGKVMGEWDVTGTAQNYSVTLPPYPLVAYRSDYYPFGEYTGSGTNTDVQFTGYENDAETNLNNANARYYSSTMGRFMSPDPYNAGANPINPQSWNMYSYVNNNPLNAIDPSGLDCIYLDDQKTSIEEIKSGDCYSDGDSGYFIDGQIYTIALYPGQAMQVTYCGTMYTETGNDPVLYSCAETEDYSMETINFDCNNAGNSSPCGAPPSGGSGTDGSGGGGSSPPQTPAPPKKTPCTPLANSLQGTPAAGIDTLLDGFNRLSHPLELVELNAIFATTGAVTAAVGAGAVFITCVPEPFEPLTCAAGVMGGVPTAAGGVWLVKQSGMFFKKVTLPALKDFGCHG